MASPSVLVFDSFEALRELLSSWLAGPHVEADGDIFYSLAWFENLYQWGLEGSPNRMGKESPKLLLVATADAASNTLICLPMLDGLDLSGLSNYYSSLYGPLIWRVAAENKPVSRISQAAWQAIALQLRNYPKRWPVLTLSPMDTQSHHFVDIQTALKSQSYWVGTYACFGNWYLSLDGRSFGDYRQTLPSALRRGIERGQRRLTAQGGWSVHIQSALDERLEPAITSFVAVYAASWKSPEPHLEFIPNLARMAARQGWLRLGVLQVENEAVAAQLWFVNSGKANIFKLAYIEGYERFSVGSVLTHAMMKHCIDQDCVQEVDYLTGDDAYKKDWMSHRRERRGIVAFDLRTVRGLWVAGRHFLGRLWQRGGPG